MLKLATTSIILFISISINAQVIVEGVNINDDPKIKMCQVIAQARAFSNKLTITIDYGQLIRYGSGKSSKVTGSDGKPVIFNSLMAATNFMLNNGWEYIDSYYASDGANGSAYRYTFKKRTNK